MREGECVSVCVEVVVGVQATSAAEGQINRF